MKVFDFHQTLRMVCMVGELIFSGESFSYVIFPGQNQNLPGLFCPVHLVHNPAYNLRLLQSDRPLQWFWEYSVLHPDTVTHPVPGKAPVLFSEALLTSFFSVIYDCPYAALLSFDFRKHKNRFMEKIRAERLSYLPGF